MRHISKQQLREIGVSVIAPVLGRHLATAKMLKARRNVVNRGKGTNAPGLAADLPTEEGRVARLGTKALNVAQTAGDVAGVIDPTGAIDATNAAVSLARAKRSVQGSPERKTHLKNAGISAAGIVPYVGDTAKIAKWAGRGTKAATGSTRLGAKAQRATRRNVQAGRRVAADHRRRGIRFPKATTPGIDNGSQDTLNAGTEIKMNRYMQTLVETRKGRDRLKIRRGRPGKVTYSKPKPAGGEGTKAADAEVTRLQNMPKPRRRTSQQNDWTKYQRIGSIIAEAWRVGPTAQRYKSLGRHKKGTRKIKDPLVKSEVKKTKANIDRKLKTKTNPRVSDLVQGSMNRRRAASKRRAKAGKSTGLPRERPEDAKADAQRDEWRRRAPGDK